jgi:hypothetical protein
VQHCFDPDFTGTDIHRNMVEELTHRKTRFDFRHRYPLLAKAFSQYATVHGFELAPILHSVGVTFNFGDLKKRDNVVKRLEVLFKFSKDAHIHIFVESGGKSQVQIARSFRRVIRTFIYSLGRLKETGYKVTVIMNRSYAPVPTPIVTDVQSRFSIIHEQNFRYSSTLQDDEHATSGIERKLEKVRVSV